MAAGMIRKEQVTLLGVVLVIIAGIGYGNWKQRATEDSIYIEGQGRWEKLAEFDARPRSEPGVAATASAPEIPASESQAAADSMPMGLLGRPLAVQSAPGAGGLDLNTASAAELDQVLPRIGPAKAEAIVAWREENGGFRSVEQLGEVPGIGPKTLEMLRPYVKVEVPALAPENFAPQIATQSLAAPASTQPSAQASPQGLLGRPSASALAPAGRAPASQPFADLPRGPININTATAAELELITGVGPVLAQRIIHERQTRGAFRSTRELRRVQGIGPKTLSKMLPEITVGH